MAHGFQAELAMVDGNPYVAVPPQVLASLFDAAGRDKGPIPVSGSINGRPYQQTLVKYAGDWRLYINLKMLDGSPRRIGEMVDVQVVFDRRDRTIDPHPKLVAALEANAAAREVFDGLAPSRRKEIVRYIDALKSDKAVDRNVIRAIDFLLGRGRFVGRDAP